MKLIEALAILQEPQQAQMVPLRVFLACGFTPLHLETFLAAHLRALHPDRRIEIQTGLFGDLIGNLGRLEKTATDAGAVVVEWSDLDPRLGLRSLGGWRPNDLGEIVSVARRRMDRIADAIVRISEKTPVAVSLPTLPPPPVSFAPGWQESAFTLQLRGSLNALGERISRCPKIRVLNQWRLDRDSPPSERLDVNSDLRSGFPYKVAHASIMAETLARLVYPPVPKKGLITDLDNTLWRGVLGEDGVQGVHWDLDHQGQIHGLYQRTLRSLSETGVLIAAASKNAPESVEEAFQREDLILSRDRVFPIEAHWGPKSESVSRILEAWNVSADSVAFIDDSPMEVAEVKRAFPEMECLEFPARDPQAAYALLERLRDLFGKEAISGEDSIRLDSLRRSAAFREAPDFSMDHFLEQAQARITFSDARFPIDSRAYELVNKTNQFNLNGRRYGEAEWRERLERDDVFLLLVSYQDKYGPLGKIAVITGRKRERTLLVDAWVMSCRAFSRRIEHRCLQALFEKYEVDEIAFDFRATPKNGPFQEFLAELSNNLTEPWAPLSREAFAEKSPRLFHQIEDSTDDKSQHTPGAVL